MSNIKQGYKQTDIGVIPEDWEIAELGEISKYQGGSQPDISFFSTRKYNSYIRLIQIRDYKTDKYTVYIPEALARRKCNKDDIMIGRYGPPIFQILKGLEGAYNVALIKAIPDQNIDKSFFYFTLKRNDLFQLIELLSRRSSGQTGVDLVGLKSFKIGLPSKGEQTAIATALSDTDALIAALDKKIAKKQQIKQGTIQQLLTGKKRLSGFSGEWVEKKICEVGKVITGSTPSRSNPDLWNGNFVWVSAQDLKSKYIVDSVEKITEDGKNTCRVLPPNSVLVTCIASIGLNALSKVACATNQQINSVVCNSDNEPEFLYYQINNNVENLKMIAGQTAVPIINKGQFENFTLMFPNAKSEQTAIAQILTDMDNEIAQLEKERDKYKELKAGMMQVLLTGEVRLV